MTARPGNVERRRQPRGGAAEPSRAQLLLMVLGTFREMPGLCLHVNQAARLFGVRTTTCQVLLDDLVAQGRLRRADDGQYLAPYPPDTRVPLPRATREVPTSAAHSRK